MPARQPVESFQVFGLRTFDNIVGKARRRRLFVPADGLEMVANKLLVKRWLGATRFPGRRIPESRRVWRQHLIGKDDLVTDSSKFEFRVCKDQPARFGMGGRPV